MAVLLGVGLLLLVGICAALWWGGRGANAALEGYGEVMDWLETPPPSGAAGLPLTVSASEREAVVVAAPVQAEADAQAETRPVPALFVRVTHGGVPLADATVWQHADGVHALGASGADGRVAVPSTPSRATFHARHGDELCGWVAFDASEQPMPEPFTLELPVERGASVTGLVRHETTGGPFEGALVLALAWTDAAALPRAWWTAPLSPGLGATTRSDASGAFELRGLDAQSRYRLLALGRGHASAFAEPAELRSPAHLAVLPVFGARFELVDRASGRPLPATSLGLSLGRVTIEGPLGTPRWQRWLAVDFLAAESGVLAPADPAIASAEGFWRVAVDEPDPMPVTVQVDVPGYALAVRDARVARLDLGAGVERIELEPVAALGTLVVHFDGLDQDPTAGARFTLGNLLLHGGADGLLVIEVSPPAGGRATFELPHGSYRYRFEADGGRFRSAGEDVADWPSVEIADTPAAIRIAWPAPRPSLELVLRDAEGRPFQGPIGLGHVPASRVTIAPDGAVAVEAATTAFLLAPPYVAHDLRPDRYWVWLDLDVEGGQWVDVVEGATARVEFVR